ncbi:hypothetical protein PG996_006790 [Apiospora saccharicola]|uniref:Uncharacterized protein n=1 Tax=Apiospora saccharicola TaxID=335842 RepID=A0ABR1V900_9PEZI
MQVQKIFIGIALAANVLAAPCAKREVDVRSTFTVETRDTTSQAGVKQLSTAGLGIWKVKGREEDQVMSTAGLGIWKS